MYSSAAEEEDLPDDAEITQVRPGLCSAQSTPTVPVERSIAHSKCKIRSSEFLIWKFACMQEDAWAVISAFFEAKGLVRQQLDSFNEFINSNMQVRFI